MDIFFYYLATAVLGIQVLYSAFVFVVSVVQLIRINRSQHPVEGEIVLIIGQLLQAAVVISAAILLFRFLKPDIVAAGIVLLLTSVLSLFDTLMRWVQNRIFAIKSDRGQV
jgi:hypothetical protein